MRPASTLDTDSIFPKVVTLSVLSPAIDFQKNVGSFSEPESSLSRKPPNAMPVIQSVQQKLKVCDSLRSAMCCDAIA
jgi:hypothetical protein